MSELKHGGRLCEAPLKIMERNNPYEAKWAGKPVPNEEKIRHFMKPKLMNALNCADSPCVDCKHKKFEVHSSMADDSMFGVALYCGLGRNPVCPDMVKAMYGDDLERDSFKRSIVGDFNDQYMNDTNSVMPTWVPKAYVTPPPRPRDEPVTASEGAW